MARGAPRRSLMSWNNQGGGPWRSPGQGPWGQGPGGSPPPSDLEEWLRRLQEGLRGVVPGGGGGLGGFGMRGVVLLALVALLVWFALGSFYSVQPNEVGINLVFGRYTGKTGGRPEHQLAVAGGYGDQCSRLGSADHRRGLSRRRRQPRHSRRKPDADRRPEHRQRALSRRSGRSTRRIPSISSSTSSIPRRRSKRSPRASCAKSSAGRPSTAC